VGYAGGELIAFLVIVFLVGVNALYVAAEYATVGVGRTRARSLVQEGLPGGAALGKLTSDPVRLDRAITACQIGISVSSLSLGAYSQIVLAPALAPWLAGWGLWGDITSHSLAVAVVLAATSSLQIVFGEQLPKSIIVRNPSPWALRVAPALWLSVWVMTPLIAFLSGSAGFLLRLGGLPSRPGTQPHSPAEIGWIVAQSARSGVLRPEQSERLRNAIQFAARTARDVMVPRVQVEALPITASVDDVRACITTTGHSRIPVYGEDLDDVRGVLHAKDLLLRAGGPGPVPSVRELMRPLPLVPWSMRALPLLELMKGEHAGLAVVLDEHGGMAGIVSLEDLVEEVLGEVEDEFDAAAPATGLLPDGRMRLRGEETLDWVNRRHGLHLTSEEAHTIGGLVMESLARVARPGDVVHQGNVRLEVEKVSGRRVVTVLVTPADNEPEGGGRETA